MRTRTSMILGGLVSASLALGLAPSISAPTTAPAPSSNTAAPGSDFEMVAKKKKRKKKKNARRRASVRIAGFERRTVEAVRGEDKITVTWPARANATGYTVAWTPLIRSIPKTPAACVHPCKRRFIRGTSMVLSAADLSTFGRTISSASGNSTHLKVFAHRGSALRWTGVTYPHDAWISPSRTAAVDWTPTMSSQMPLPHPPAAGDTVAVSSFNVLSASASGVPSWSSRAPKIVSQMNDTGASIVATQENSNSNQGVGNSKAQYVDLADRLRPHGWTLADDRNWDTQLGMSRSWSTQATRTYYKSSIWTQTARGALLTHTPIGGQTTGINVDRWVSWTKLRSNADPLTQICVLNAHLISNQGTYDRASADHRNSEIAQIRSELENPNSTVRRVGTRVGEACAGTPMVLAGDFNSAQEHAPYGNQPQATMLQAGFVDTKNAASRHNTRVSGPGTVTAWHATWGTQIDYLLTKGMGGAKSFTVNVTAPDGTGSDHHPITARVNVPHS